MSHSAPGDRDAGSRIALIFPPAMPPTSPPLGLACLKGYLQSPAVPWQGAVRVFDLNLAHYEQALRWMQDGRLKMSLQKMDAATTARHIMNVLRFFRGEEGMDAFLDLHAYDGKASLYRSFQTVLDGLFENFARRILADLAVPPLVERYFQELLEPVRAFSPSLTGFSILFSQQIHFALALAKLLKKTRTETMKIVLGGATLSVMPHPEALLTEPIVARVGGERHTLEINRFVDYLVAGEGETSLAALASLARLSSLGSLSPSLFSPSFRSPDNGSSRHEGDLSGVPGLVYLEEGELKCNPAEMITDLNRLPLPDFSDFALSDYHSPLPILPYLSSRGCFWGRCAFCTHQKTYLAYREESVKKTAESLSELKERYKVSHFSLVDEMIHPHRFAGLSRAIVERGLQIHYSAYAKPTRRFDASLLKRLHASGARVLMWGVESGSQRVLDAMKKGTCVTDMERVLCEAHDVDIWNLIFTLFGFPTETREEWEETLCFLRASRDAIDALSKSRFILLAGSEIFLDPGRYGIARIQDRPDRDPVSVAYDYTVASGLSQEEVQALYEEAMPELSHYGRSPYLGQFRDHLLIHASLMDQRSDTVAGLKPS